MIIDEQCSVHGDSKEALKRFWSSPAIACCSKKCDGIHPLDPRTNKNQDVIMNSQKKFQDITKGLKDDDTIKMRVDEFNEGVIEIQRECRTNKIAGIINSLFLDSEYAGKDWEAVRKTLIKELSSL